MDKWTPPSIVGISRLSDDKALFSTLGVELRSSRPPDHWALCRDNSPDSPLTLVRPDAVSLAIDFTAGKARHRASESGSGAQALTRALGVKTYVRTHSEHPVIIDATGGLGQDAWALASTGCRLTIIERHPLVYALLSDALARALSDSGSNGTASNIHLVKGEAEGVLERLCTPRTHAIYLDPMYPEKRRNAATKKGMQFLHALLGPPEESPSLLQAAIASGLTRVAVKRPKGAPHLAGTESFDGQRTQLDTPNTRYDIYHCRKISAAD